MQPRNSQEALTNYQNIQANRRKPQDILRESEQRLGIPTATQRQVGLRGAITNTENLIRNVDPSVSGRTSGSLVTEAQKQRLIAMEREPLTDQFREQSRALEGETASLTELQRRAREDAQLAISADDAAENAARGLYDTLYQREQDEIARQERAKAATANPGDWLSKYLQGLGGNQPTRPSLDSFFGGSNTIPVTQSTGSTIPLSVSKPVPTQPLSVAKPKPQPTLSVRPIIAPRLLGVQ